ncbi:MAG: GNAT family N-acetyltransferase [Desulforhopalus sp.]
MQIEWKLSTFDELSTSELYAILQLRQHVFVVEQQCIYQECDGRDKDAHHLVGWHDRRGQPEPVAYLRLLHPEKSGGSPAIGRVVTHPDHRGKGLGREIMTRCLRTIEIYYPNSPVIISAQQYLTHFYLSLGFVVSSEGYQEDGIPHISMTRYPQV